MTRKIALGLSLIVLAALLSGLYWFNWLFEEDSAAFLPSLTAKLGVQRVLFIGAHPDDEQLVTGLLVQADQEGLQTYMLTATKGEKGDQYPVIARKVDQGLIRQAETLKNSFALGVDAHDVLDFPDGYLQQGHAAALVAAVRERLLRWRPDLVVSFWPQSGFSNHPDHMQMGTAVEAAAQQLAAAPVDGYAGPRYIAYALAPSRALSMFGGERGQQVVAHQPAPDFAIDGAGWAKIRGWDIHASQAGFVQADYGMPAGLIHRIYDKEFYRVLPPPR
ncbi:PIG-L deacetylase family protein [Pseudomonas sp. N040]|uniref:PIG-L deacetylase family protein n=1 Tax=Pseudomonas sp. N040 TaxID=2785325 RepID=UPI0018A32F18|nr:PIG-L family deacetylase [Pseudomonas sp. N040]MBF7730969.1 PIG-L family deacetylase [Pseudomonas sp. N040]MBW7014612.1 PIG-L family deacetylase [Pseudomonas sp. N040]